MAVTLAPAPIAPTRDAVVAALSAMQAHLQAAGVAHLYLFGSTARDAATGASDIDVFIEVARRPFDLFDLVGVGQDIEDVLGRKVDVMTRNGIAVRLRESIEADAIRIF